MNANNSIGPGMEGLSEPQWKPLLIYTIEPSDFFPMKTQEKLTPAQVADGCEMLAQHECDGGDREAAALFMKPCNAIRQLLLTLARLNERVHNGYDFNADPDGMTLEVGDILSGKDGNAHERAD